MKIKKTVKLEVGEFKDIWAELAGRSDSRNDERLEIFLAKEIVEEVRKTKRGYRPVLKGILSYQNNWDDLFCLKKYGGLFYEIDRVLSPPEGEGGSVLPKARELLNDAVKEIERFLTERKAYKRIVI